MNRSMMTLLAAAFLTLAACDEKKTDTKTDDPATKSAPTIASAPAPVATPEPAPVAINDSDLATPADFEEQAEKAITKTNYKTELASLETDISKPEATP